MSNFASYFLFVKSLQEWSFLPFNQSHRLPWNVFILFQLSIYLRFLHEIVSKSSNIKDTFLRLNSIAEHHSVLFTPGVLAEKWFHFKLLVFIFVILKLSLHPVGRHQRHFVHISSHLFLKSILSTLLFRIDSQPTLASTQNSYAGSWSLTFNFLKVNLILYTLNTKFLLSYSRGLKYSGIL